MPPSSRRRSPTLAVVAIAEPGGRILSELPKALGHTVIGEPQEPADEIVTAIGAGFLGKL
jgi:hypothetical protein